MSWQEVALIGIGGIVFVYLLAFVVVLYLGTRDF